MSPHRLTTIGRYKISNDVLILILEKMDPDTLYITSKVFTRVYNIVMEYLPLRYKFELALAGMKNGSVAGRLPIATRFNLLLAYRTDWPSLKWTHEQKAHIPLLGRFGVTGNFVHFVAQHGVELMELPSCRTNRPPSQTRHVRIPTAPRVEYVALDTTQNLIVTSHVLTAPNQIGVLLKIRDLWTFNKHKESASDHFSFNVPAASGMTLNSIDVSICGDKLLARLELHGPSSRSEHLIVNWKNHKAAWFSREDLQFLNPSQLLVIERYNNVPFLFLYNIRDITQPQPERQYQLPDAWNACTVNFHKNSAPVIDRPTASNALFYSNPVLRVILLSARPINHSRPINWMILNESYFYRPLPYGYRGPPMFAWKDWGHYTIVRNTSLTRLTGKPVVFGSRVLYLDQSNSNKAMSRINLINFAPYAERATTVPQMWDFVGQRTRLVPCEVSKEISSVDDHGHKLQDLRVTEDNIVLFYENRNNQMPINILTFGVPGAAPYPH